MRALDKEMRYAWLSHRDHKNYATATATTGARQEPTGTVKNTPPSLLQSSFHLRLYRELFFASLSKDTCRTLVRHLSQSLQINIMLTEESSKPGTREILENCLLLTNKL